MSTVMSMEWTGITQDQYNQVMRALDLDKNPPAGAIFPFDLGPGFAGFKTPATFLKVNRALLARVLVYRASLGALPAGTYAPSAVWRSVRIPSLYAMSARFSGPTSRLRRAYTVLSERSVPFSIDVAPMYEWSYVWGHHAVGGFALHEP